MAVYVDLVFLFNCLADAAALYVTARLSGLPVRRRRILAAALAGGTYGALCALPGLAPAASFLPQMAAAAGLVWLCFGRRRNFLRRFLLFFLLSCTMGGALVAACRLAEESGWRVLGRLDWRVFLLAGGTCFAALSVVFRGEARHAAAGQLCRCEIQRRGRRVRLAALLDTGHTLSDPCTGRPVLTAHWEALEPLWTDREREALALLETEGAAAVLTRLGPGSGFRALPYRTVGVSSGLLVCFRADRARVDGRELGEITVALSPEAVSEGGAAALWGGEIGKEGGGHAA